MSNAGRHQRALISLSEGYDLLLDFVLFDNTKILYYPEWETNTGSENVNYS